MDIGGCAIMTVITYFFSLITGSLRGRKKIRRSSVFSNNILPHASFEEMQVGQERICRFCKKLLNPLQGKRLPVVSVLNRF